MNHCSILNASWLRPSLLAAAIFATSVTASAEDYPVAEVQTVLKLKHYYYGEVDGSFDGATQNALRRFQFRNGLPGTGAMDPATMHTLCGYPAPAKATVANNASQIESDRQPAPPVEKYEISAGIHAVSNADCKKSNSVAIIAKERPIAPHTGYSEQFPSWAAEHRGGSENGIEIRRAIPVTPPTGGQDQFIPRAIPVYPTNPIGEAGDREGVTTVAAHFTGQDGHVYTYFRKMKTLSPDAIDDSGATAATSAWVSSDGERFRGGNFVNR
jgi:peptidoglycan hydrolase-like protein with peptidoglycan-binding domain